MNFVNPPTETPQHVSHRTFYSKLVNHDIGYNIYLPPEYEESDKRYPVVYYLHGCMSNESSDIWTIEKLYRSREAITVFANGTEYNGYRNNELPIESVMITELIPHIDGKYRTDTNREKRAISGFSMGGGGAFYYAVKYPELFNSVSAYAGTHDYELYEDFDIKATPEKAAEIYENIF